MDSKQAAAAATDSAPKAAGDDQYQHGMAEASPDAETAATSDAQEIVVVDSPEFDLIAATLYHRSRVAWFVTLHRVSLFLTLLASTGAVAAVVQQNPKIALTVSMLAALVSAAGLAFDFSGGARKHDDCRRTYHDLAAMLAEDPSCGVACRVKMIRAAASEPATFEAANAIAFNAAIRSLGLDEDDRFVLTPWQYFTRNLWHYSGRRFPTVRELSLKS